MNEQELEIKSTNEIAHRVEQDGPPEPHVLNTDSQNEWDSRMFRHLNLNTIHVLGRAADIIVYFDRDGRWMGWRDDGRKGTAMPGWVDRDALLKAVVDELGLPTVTRLGSLEPVELPPVGWTHQAVLFLAPVPLEDQILRVWVSPENLRVIQCLYGPRKTQEGGE